MGEYIKTLKWRRVHEERLENIFLENHEKPAATRD